MGDVIDSYGCRVTWPWAVWAQFGKKVSESVSSHPLRSLLGKAARGQPGVSVRQKIICGSST